MVFTLWMAAPIIERWKQDGRYQEALDIFRCPMVPGAPIPLFAWLKENQPERVAEARYCIFAKDSLGLCLGGDIATDYTDASCGSLLDHAEQRYTGAFICGSVLTNCSPCYLRFTPAPNRSLP
ncbi:MAG: L-xylulokinase [Arenicella sp.]|jgi:L-xylulokinase